MNSRTNSDMMNLQINPVNFSASDRLTEYLQKKTEKLTTYFDRIVDDPRVRQVLEAYPA